MVFEHSTELYSTFQTLISLFANMLINHYLLIINVCAFFAGKIPVHIDKTSGEIDFIN